MIDPAMMRAMLNAGCTADQIVAVAEDAARVADEKKADKRAKNAERQRRFRNARNALHGVTNADNTLQVSPKKETPPTPPKEKTTPSGSGDKSPSQTASEFFEAFWLAYPRREGSNPKKPAFASFARLIAKGYSPDAIIAAAQRLAIEHPTPTRFIPQAVTWLNQERLDDTLPLIPGDTFCPEDMPSTRLHLLRFRNENDGHDPPRAVQGGKAGYLIPAEWVKAMDMRAQAHG